MSRRSRRSFIRNAAAGAAGGLLLGAGAPGALHAASQDCVAGVNRRVRVALIGCGGIGTTDLRAALRLGAQCVARCDVDDEQVRKVGRARQDGLRSDARAHHARSAGSSSGRMSTP